MTSAWNEEWRRRRLPALAGQEWDLIVVGGGISGAGILREAARRGWRCLLLEQRDFAWGTSSRSSKMVHGGLRYIAKGQWRLTRDSVRERQRLLGEAPGLVEPLSFVMAHYRGGFPGPRLFGGLLSVYDALAGRRNHRFYDAAALRYLAPGLKEQRLLGGTRFFDAVTDDARLVLRVLAEARHDGGEAFNGMRVRELLREGGQVVGLRAEDRESGELFDFRCRALALATGAWADELRQPGGSEHIRPLRGSHLLLPAWRLPVAHAFSFMHATDRRPVFVFPWEGATVVGTTDLDHRDGLGGGRADQPRRTRLPAGGLRPAVSRRCHRGARRAVDLGRRATGGQQRRRQRQAFRRETRACALARAGLRDPGRRQADHLPAAGGGGATSLRGAARAHGHGRWRGGVRRLRRPAHRRARQRPATPPGRSLRTRPGPPQAAGGHPRNGLRGCQRNALGRTGVRLRGGNGAASR
ncbi:glycerol-3-phosphate dehydrogenase/oxidase [Pseudomonas aeruginosa]|uniref:glycerol-3-phosphate dehydrogenase/oxidase n=1 Tax=Pseudomonas aeruginosa TaxID=287 RepID=UPI00390C8E2C